MPNSEELRRRLEALNRQKLPPSPGSGGAKSGEGSPDAAKRDVAGLRRRLRKSQRARRSSAASGAPTSSAGPGGVVYPRDPTAAPRPTPERKALPRLGRHVVLEDEVRGAAVEAAGGGSAFVVERRPGESGDRFGHLGGALVEALGRRDTELAAELERSGVSSPPRPEDLVFIDLETTGLGSSPLFLIGAMVWEDGRLVVRQYFARDYTEERAALELFLALASPRALLVSFNGKSFDLPYVRMRAAYNGLRCALDPAHLDILHAARRIWRDRLPDCRLQTLEKYVCGRWRRGDIPGSQIPEAYHEYVRAGNAARMVEVLEHNYLDLVTLGEILVRMPGAGQRQSHTEGAEFAEDG